MCVSVVVPTVKFLIVLRFPYCMISNSSKSEINIPFRISFRTCDTRSDVLSWYRYRSDSLFSRSLIVLVLSVAAAVATKMSALVVVLGVSCFSLGCSVTRFWPPMYVHLRNESVIFCCLACAPFFIRRHMAFADSWLRLIPPMRLTMMFRFLALCSMALKS